MKQPETVIEFVKKYGNKLYGRYIGWSGGAGEIDGVFKSTSTIGVKTNQGSHILSEHVPIRFLESWEILQLKL